MDTRSTQHLMFHQSLHKSHSIDNTQVCHLHTVVVRNLEFEFVHAICKVCKAFDLKGGGGISSMTLKKINKWSVHTFRFSFYERRSSMLCISLNVHK